MDVRSLILCALLSPSVCAAAPVITAVSDNPIDAGGPYFRITIRGTGFVNGAVARLSMTPLDTSFISVTEIKAAIPSELRITSGQFALTVSNPDASVSNAFSILISPVIGSVSPAYVQAGSAAVTISITGIGFISGDTVVLSIGGGRTLLATTWINSANLTAVVPASAMTTPASATLQVVGPATESSALLPFAIEAPPVISFASPNRFDAGGPFFLMTVTGSGFTSASSARLGATLLVTTFISATEIRAAIPPEVRPLSGTFPLTIMTPGGLVSAAYPIQISPVLNSVGPSSVLAGSPPTSITASGVGFTPNNLISINGSRLATVYLSSTSLATVVPGNLLATPVTFLIQVVDSVGPGASSPVPFIVRTTPAISLASPNSMDAGGPGLIMTINGSGFVPASILTWAGAPIGSIYVSPTQLTATITPGMRALAGTYPVAVTDPSGAGSAPYAITISPVLFSIAPSSAAALGPAVTITAAGTGFTRNHAVSLNGAALPTNYLSSTALTATIPASALSSPGTASVQVIDSMGSGRSLSHIFTIDLPGPAITLLSPSSVLMGAPATRLTIAGANFVPDSIAQWNGNPLASTFQSATVIIASLPAGLLAEPANAAITVMNPGAAVSPPATFSVSPTTPVLTALTPATITAGSPGFTLIVSGSNFAPGAVVWWNGQALQTAFAGASRLSASAPAELLNLPRSIEVAVANPGGFISRPVLFLIVAALPVPSISAVLNAFSSTHAIAPGSLISIYGANLAPAGSNAATVTINELPTPLFFASAVQINAQVPVDIPPGEANLIVRYNDVASAPAVIRMAPVAPGILTSPTGRFAVAQDAPTGALITPQNPASPGQYVTLYLTGQGAVDPPVATGVPAPAAPFAQPLAAVEAMLGDLPARVIFAGLAPGLVGVLQLNILIPELPPGEHQLEISIGGQRANPAILPVGAPALR